MDLTLHFETNHYLEWEAYPPALVSTSIYSDKKHQMTLIGRSWTQPLSFNNCETLKIKVLNTYSFAPQLTGALTISSSRVGNNNQFLLAVLNWLSFHKWKRVYKTDHNNAYRNTISSCSVMCDRDYFSSDSYIFFT